MPAALTVASQFSVPNRRLDAVGAGLSGGGDAGSDGCGVGRGGGGCVLGWRAVGARWVGPGDAGTFTADAGGRATLGSATEGSEVADGATTGGSASSSAGLAVGGGEEASESAIPAS
jgi:hypothetical protein